MLRSSLAGPLLVSLLLSAAIADAEPLDLADPTPRWIAVAFEVSPRNQPAQTNSVYTESVPARLETGAEPGQIVIRIDRDYVEGVLFANDEPLSGSFSDFVWVFDSHTGEVVSATLSGSLTLQLNWGFFRTRARTEVAAEMATSRVAGLEEPRRRLGQELFGYCDDPADSDCRLVAGRGYDAKTGYVHAVGPLSVQVSGVAVQTYSPLGEAIFYEQDTPEIPGSAEDREGSDSRAPIATVGSLTAPGPKPTPAVSAGPSPAP